jgi:hypothetical protein
MRQVLPLALVAPVLSLVASFAATAVAFGQEPPEFNAKCGDIACRVERVPAKWQLLSVGRDLDRLKLVYESGRCRRGDGRARVTETASRIRIAVDEGEVVAIDTPDPHVACTQEIRYRSLYVQLRRPVAGRRVVGGTGIAGGLSGRRMPRVIGLAFEDARELLRSYPLEVRRFGDRTGAVAFQSPRPGRGVPDDMVGLTLGRHAFHAHALQGCLDAVGVPTVPVRPELGNQAAPDLELSPSGKGALAFFAFYADPARARENAPRIRRRVAGTKAVVDRLGRVTIIWVKPPDPLVRERAHACVAGAKP